MKSKFLVFFIVFVIIFAIACDNFKSSKPEDSKKDTNESTMNKESKKIPAVAEKQEPFVVKIEFCGS